MDPGLDFKIPGGSGDQMTLKSSKNKVKIVFFESRQVVKPAEMGSFPPEPWVLGARRRCWRAPSILNDDPPCN